MNSVNLLELIALECFDLIVFVMLPVELFESTLEFKLMNSF